MAGLQYVGGDYTEDGNPLDVVTKVDLDNQSTGLIAEAPASQVAVGSAINTAVSSLASQTSVNAALNAFITPGYLTSGNVFTIALSANAVGSYTLSYGTSTTTALAVGAPATALQAALSAFTNLTSVTVAGGTGGPYTVSLSPVGVSTLTANSGLTAGSITINQSPLIPASWKGTYVAPLNSSGVIPSQYVPSLGQGYVLGPFGTTALYTGSTGATPLKIADWNIGTQAMNFQPIAFMSLLASAANGGRPCVEIGISSGSQIYGNQTIIARGVGRNAWNDKQSITVIPIPAAAGHTGLAGSGYPPSFTNIWASAWLRDLNAQSVTVGNNAIFSGLIHLIRYE